MNQMIMPSWGWKSQFCVSQLTGRGEGGCWGKSRPGQWVSLPVRALANAVLLNPGRSSHGGLRQQFAMGQASVQSRPDGARGPPAPALSVFPVTSRFRDARPAEEGGPGWSFEPDWSLCAGNLGCLDWGRNHEPGFWGKEGVPCCDCTRWGQRSCLVYGHSSWLYILCIIIGGAESPPFPQNEARQPLPFAPTLLHSYPRAFSSTPLFPLSLPFLARTTGNEPSL